MRRGVWALPHRLRRAALRRQYAVSGPSRLGALRRRRAGDVVGRCVGDARGAPASSASPRGPRLGLVLALPLAYAGPGILAERRGSPTLPDGIGDRDSRRDRTCLVLLCLGRDAGPTRSVSKN